jgi:hypothetical protein
VHSEGVDEMTKLEELKAAYAAATGGEWTAPGFNSQGGKVACLLNNHDGLRLVSGNFKQPDAEFIALAHNLMPQLLEAVGLLKDHSNLLGQVLDSTCYELDDGQRELVEETACLMEELLK